MANTLFNDNNKLNEYRNDETIKKMLDGCVLLNHSEFISWFKPLTITKATRNAHSRKRQLVNEEVGHIAFDILDDLADVVCKGKIGRQYGMRAIRNVSENFDYAKHDMFDILVAVEPRYNKINLSRGTHTVEKDKLQSVLGFIVVEKGECQLLKDIYSVHLICTRESKSKAIKGAVLLGAYLYCIKSSDEIAERNKRGILELAGGYMNLSGFFAYSKLGFDKDNSLYDELHCFKDAGNLPMSVDLTKYSSQDIIAMVNGTKKRDAKDDTGIYQIGVPKDEMEKIIQTNVAILSNMKQMLVLDKEPSGEEYNRIMNDVDKMDKVGKIKKLDEYIRTQLAQLKKVSHSQDSKERRKRKLIRTQRRKECKSRKLLHCQERMQTIRQEKESKKRTLSEKRKSMNMGESMSMGETREREENKSSKEKRSKKKICTPKNSTKKQCAHNGCCVISG